MSHLGHIDESPRRRRADCRKGSHDYGEPQNVGAGILRRVCQLCAMVSIDLTNTDEPTTPLTPDKPSMHSMADQQSEAR